MSIKNEITPIPSKFKAQFKKFEIPACSVATHLGFSYPYVLNLLNGIARITPEVDEKLQALINQLEAEV